MKYVEAHGARIPALGFGTFMLEGSEARRMVERALGTGYRHIDTAQNYGNEAEVGRGIADADVDREEVFLTTKVWVANFAGDRLRRSVGESRRRLGTDYIDLLLLHWPNPDVPPAETIETLNEVRAAGKARHIGVSNFTVRLLAEARDLSEAPLVTNQVEYHPFLNQAPVLNAVREAGMMLTAYSPLAQGEVVENETLQEIGRAHGSPPRRSRYVGCFSRSAWRRSPGRRARNTRRRTSTCGTSSFHRTRCGRSTCSPARPGGSSTRRASLRTGTSPPEAGVCGRDAPPGPLYLQKCGSANKKDSGC